VKSVVSVSRFEDEGVEAPDEDEVAVVVDVVVETTGIYPPPPPPPPPLLPLGVDAGIAEKLAVMVWLATTLGKLYEVTAPTDTPSTNTLAI
jgi:hypothetical protein